MSEQRKKRILYIDDELAMMEAVIKLLQIDYDVESVRDADQALELLKEAAPGFDLVVLDVRMPQGKRIHDPNRGRTMGFELVKQILQIHPGILIIIYTVVHDEKLHEQLYEAGAKAVILKTESVSHLREEIKKCLKRLR